MSIFECSITIDVCNRTPDLNLAFSDAQASSGSTPAANPVQISPGETMVIQASDSAGACVGSFVLSSGGTEFRVSYNHPFTAEDATVGAVASIGYLGCTDAAYYTGHDVQAAVTLYQGVQANDDGGLVVPLLLLASSPVNNCQDFANSMFGSNVRSASVIQGSYDNPSTDGFVVPADFTGGQFGRLAGLWVSQWMGSGTSLPQQDCILLSLLADYISQASSAGALTMWVPQIAYQSGASPPTYSLNGYQSFSFTTSDGSWDESTVSAFLTLLAGGGHFVAISATSDLPENVSMQAFDQYFSERNLTSRHDPGNSHYTSLTNITGTYYLDIEQDFAPPDCGLILSLLLGRTVNSLFPENGTYNTFFQLEGWQNSLTSERHNADYETFQQTLWNISTYGACPYSEKRATTIFLAPPGWTPIVYQITRMMPYVGAYATSSGDPQAWLDTAVVTIPTDAPALPERYYEPG